LNVYAAAATPNFASVTRAWRWLRMRRKFTQTVANPESE
jgi:hypothetical protein